MKKILNIPFLENQLHQLKQWIHLSQHHYEISQIKYDH